MWILSLEVKFGLCVVAANPSLTFIVELQMNKHQQSNVNNSGVYDDQVK